LVWKQVSKSDIKSVNGSIYVESLIGYLYMIIM